MVDATPYFSEQLINEAAALYADSSALLTPARVNAALAIHNWRAAHQLPVARFRSLLQQRAKEIDFESTVATRLKRVPTMMEKLVRMNARRKGRPFTLWEMQDIGGLRAIVQTPAHVRELAARLLDTSGKFVLVGTPTDYCDRPKKSGYRSIHLVYRYLADEHEDQKLNGLKFEVQIRSRLQHAWATSNEIVGTFRREALKSGEGDPSWLRFFELAGSAIAMAEGLPKSTNVPHDEDLFALELGELKRRLNVFDRLSAYNVTQSVAKSPMGHNAKYFVIAYDLTHRTVSVSPFDAGRFQEAMASYAEKEQWESGNTDFEIVFVSVDSLSELEEAYPNYFADTEDFLLAIYTKEEVAAIDARPGPRLPDVDD